MLRSGDDYIAGLRDNRVVLLGNERVGDVTEHPAFRNAVASVARLYDAAHNNPEVFAYTEDDGVQHNVVWQRPRTQDDLLRRRRAHAEWAKVTHGLIGRSPDHVAGYVTGMACNPSVANAHGQGFDDNVVNYWKYVRDNDLYIAYAITSPSRARSTDVFGKQPPKAADEEATPAMRVVGTSNTGITVRGTKILATSAVIADELFVGNILPLRPGEEDYAVSFAIPTATEGVSLIPRKSYEQHATSRSDDPLASRYDETDSVIFFDDVHVPWNRVFSYGHLDTALALFMETPAHMLGNAQAQTRLLTKMRLALGIVRRVSEVTGTINIPPVKDAYAGLAYQVAMLEGLIAACDARPQAAPNGYVTPHAQTLYATTAWATESVPGFFHGLRELLGSQPFQQAADVTIFEDAETAALMVEAFGTDSPANAKARYQLMRVAWDLVGSEFASRHMQYEMFYAGAKHVTRARMNQTFDWSVVADEADRCLRELDQWINQSAPETVALTGAGVN